jgi:hypothetical protein
VRHLEIAQHEIEVPRRQFGQCDGPVGRGADLETFHREKIGEDVTDDLLVIDDQDTRRSIVRGFVHRPSDAG